jgi:hypothetical protein
MMPDSCPAFTCLVRGRAADRSSVTSRAGSGLVSNPPRSGERAILKAQIIMYYCTFRSTGVLVPSVLLEWQKLRGNCFRSG